MLIDLETNEVLVAFFNSVLSYFDTERQPTEELLELKFKELLLNIISNPNKELTAYLHKVFLSGNDDLRDIMERNYLYNLSLEEFARLGHRSLSKFKRDFDTVFGMSPGKWLMEKRLDYASRLLFNSKKSITDIVIESGFINITHFDRIFKKHFGATPLQHRKKFSSTIAYLDPPFGLNSKLFEPDSKLFLKNQNSFVLKTAAQFFATGLNLIQKS